MNLIKNSFKFTRSKDGSGCVELLIKNTKNLEHLKFKVTDNGEGI